MSMQSKPSSPSSSTKSPHGNAPTQKSQLRIILSSLIAGVFGAAWILLHSPYAAKGPAGPRQADIVRQMTYNLTGEQVGGQRGGRGRPGRGDYRFAEKSLFVANLTSIVGDYVVSVRRVHDYTYSFDDNPAAGDGSIQPEPFIVSMQVMSTRPDGLKQIESMTEGFSITDSDGKRILPTTLLSETNFPQGRGCVFKFPAIASNTEYLQSVDGMLRLSPSAGTAESSILPFHIKNVPLPWQQRVFGVVGAGLLDANVARALDLSVAAKPQDKVEWIAGEKMEAVLKRLPPEAFHSPDLPREPNRVVLTQNVSNLVRLPLVSISNVVTPPASSLSCAVSPRLLTDGEVATRLLLKGEGRKAIQATRSVWSNTPQMLIVPARQLFSGLPASIVLVLYLDFYLDNLNQDNPMIIPLPRSLRARQGDRGSALAGHVIASGGPLGVGSTKLAVSRLTSAGLVEDKTETLTTTLDEQGNFMLSNLAAGHYRVTLLETQPVISPVAVHTTFEHYLARRCGITRPVVDQATQDIFVRPGDRAELSPWIYKQQQ